MGFLRWWGRNLSTLLLAFVLAVVVWVSAVVAADPNEEAVFPQAIDLEVIGQDQTLLQTEKIPTQVHITLNAPRSIWDQLNVNPDLIQAWIDLSGLDQGEHIVQVKTQIGLNPVQVVKIEPKEVKVVLEPQKTNQYYVQLSVTGDPALGYRKGTTIIAPQIVSVSGPESIVNQVKEVRASLDISGANETIRRSVTVQAVDGSGVPVTGLTLSPQTVSLTEPINLLGGYRNVVVKVVTTGEVADGYWLTNISVTPPNVTVFSTNPSQVNALPGFVETNVIDLTNLSDDVDIRATLNLTDGITLVGEESVLVRLSIAARDGNLPITLPLEVVGLPPDKEASFSPDTVDVMLAGPLPILNNLKSSSIRVAVNLTSLDPGVYQVSPVVDLLPSQVRVVYILPDTIEVTITESATMTPTVEAGAAASLPVVTGTPTVAPTATPTPTPTVTPTVTPTPTLPAPTPTP